MQFFIWSCSAIQLCSLIVFSEMWRPMFLLKCLTACLSSIGRVKFHNFPKNESATCLKKNPKWNNKIRIHKNETKFESSVNPRRHIKQRKGNGASWIHWWFFKLFFSVKDFQHTPPSKGFRRCGFEHDIMFQFSIFRLQVDFFYWI